MKLYLLFAIVSVVIGAWTGFETPADQLTDDLAQYGEPPIEGAIALDIADQTTVSRISL